MTSLPAPTATAAIRPESTVGAIVAAQPGLARVFEPLGIDFCCGGKQTLATACERRGLDLSAVLAAIESARLAIVTGPAEVNAAAMGLAELADHIETTHHTYLKAELPRLVEMADRVATKHSWRDGRLVEVAAAVNDLAADMTAHMHKEETILFPLVRMAEAEARPNLNGSALAGPIQQMEAEHEAAGDLTARLRALTDNFSPDANACNTHRALLAGLAEFEADLHRHVHKENNVLFPRALRVGAA